MKKLYAFLFSIGLVSAVSAQVEIREYSGTGGTQIGNDISGTTFSVVATGNADTIHFAVKNVSGATQYYRVRRLRLDVPNGWEDGLCWGQDPDLEGEAQCYSPSLMSSNPWTSPNPPSTGHAHTINDGNIFDLKIDFGYGDAGVGHYRYYVMPNQGSTPIDSIDIEVTKTLGLTEEKEILGMTAYPNPANNVLTVNTTGVDDNVTLRITDVLGKVVYNDVVAPTKKVDVSDYKNGVYLVSVYKEGVLVQTRRVVVKH